MNILKDSSINANVCQLNLVVCLVRKLNQNTLHYFQSYSVILLSCLSFFRIAIEIFLYELHTMCSKEFNIATRKDLGISSYVTL